MTAFERFADCAVSWLPMYGEAKLALVVYLWHPNTMASRRSDRDDPTSFFPSSVQLIMGVIYLHAIKKVDGYLRAIKKFADTCVP
jgi:hypothetical protein